MLDHMFKFDWLSCWPSNSYQASLDDSNQRSINHFKGSDRTMDSSLPLPLVGGSSDQISSGHIPPVWMLKKKKKKRIKEWSLLSGYTQRIFLFVRLLFYNLFEKPKILNPIKLFFYCIRPGLKQFDPSFLYLPHSRSVQQTLSSVELKTSGKGKSWHVVKV